MRPWLALAALIVAGALAWLFADGARGVAAWREVGALRPATRAKRGPAALVDVPAVDVAAAEEATPSAERSAVVEIVPPTQEQLLQSAERFGALEVHVLAGNGAPWADGPLRVLAATSPIDRNHRPLFSPTVDGGGGQPWMSRFSVWELTTDEGVYSLYRTDAEGYVEVFGVTPGQPFALVAVDALGTPGGRLDEPPMAPGERRSVTLIVARFDVPLEGRCLAAYGAPASGATVEVHAATGMQRLTCDDEGRFSCGPLFAERVSLSADHEQHGVAALVDVDPRAGPVELWLRAPRLLRVRLVGERDTYLAVSGITLDTGAATLRSTNPNERSSRHVFERVPRRPVTLVLDEPVPGRRLEVDAETESVTWTVPEVGLLVVRAGRIGGPPGTFQLLLGDDTGSESPFGKLDDTGEQVLRARCWVGEYTLQIVHTPQADPRASVPWGAPIPFSIRRGETTRLAVGN